MNEFLLLWLGFNCMFNRNETSPLKNAIYSSIC